MNLRLFAALAASTAFALPAQAQESLPEETVFDGDYLTLGVGGVLNPSYAGSDDYVITPVPLVQGSLGGVDIDLRAAGIALDFVRDPDEGVGLDLGIAARLRNSRHSQIEDEVVEMYGKLDRAIEIGPTAGVTMPGVLNQYDSLIASVDVLWDINGAHGGMVVSPTVSYFTPLSRGIAANLTLSADWADEDFHDYYFRVSPLDYIGPGASPLPAFEPDGGGFTRAGATLLLAFDANGEIADGGLGFAIVAGYSRMLGDAKDTPFTSVRGSADQFLAGVLAGFTF